MTDTELLIEALARLEAIDMVLGDPGGPRHPKDYWDTERLVRWVAPLHSDPPDWEHETDPLIEALDAHSDAVTARSLELRRRVRAEDERYQARVLAQRQALA